MSFGQDYGAEHWLSRWREGRIGFHSDAVQPVLETWWPRLDIASDASVLMPLCGKSGDIGWLARQGHPVLGVELAREAVDGWFEAQGSQTTEVTSRPGFERFHQPAQAGQAAVTLDVGNFFHLEPCQTDRIGGFYDRAALIALPGAARQRYAFQLAQLCRPGVEGLLVSFTREARQDQGPPYVVDDDEVIQLFGPNFELEKLGEHPDARGMIDHAWWMRRKTPL